MKFYTTTTQESEVTEMKTSISEALPETVKLLQVKTAVATVV